MAPFARVSAALAVALAVSAAADDAVPPTSYDGSWTAAAPVGAASGGPASTLPDAGAPHRGGGSHGGHGGMRGGGAGGRGGGGYHRGADAPAVAAGASDAERNDPGLRRLFAAQLTITKLAHPDRLRFDDGVHPVELSLDGMNVTGPAVGGTVALSATSPELVVDTVTTSGYTVQEHYRLADDGAHLELHAGLKKPGASDAREITRTFDRGVAKPADAKPAG